MTDMSDEEKKARVRFLIICSICCFSEYLAKITLADKLYLPGFRKMSTKGRRLFGSSTCLFLRAGYKDIGLKLTFSPLGSSLVWLWLMKYH